MSNASPSEGALSGRRCLVTGATGFLGRALVPRLLRAGAHVTAQVRSPANLPGVELRLGDMAEPGWAAATRAEWRWDDVVHLAGPVSASRGEFTDDAKVTRAHAVIALSLAAAIPEAWTGRVVHTSSMTVYGAAPRLPVPEDQPLAPRFAYALGKVLAEDVWRASRRPDVWLLRLPGLFSAERRSGGLYHFVRAGLDGRAIELTAREPTLWDILHVDDAAEAILRALASPRAFRGAMNVSYGEVVSLERVGARIAELTRGQGVVNVTGVSHPEFQLDISRAAEYLSWPPCSLDERLRELVRQWEGRAI